MAPGEIVTPRTESIVEWAVRGSKLHGEIRRDVRQEAWLGIVEAAGRHDPGLATLSTFAQRVARCRVADCMRREDPLSRAHRKAVKDGRESEPQRVELQDYHGLVSVPSQVGDVLARECRDAIGKLKPSSRDVILRLFWLEQTADHAAVECRITPRALYKRRSVALQELRHLLA